MQEAYTKVLMAQIELATTVWPSGHGYTGTLLLPVLETPYQKVPWLNDGFYGYGSTIVNYGYWLNSMVNHQPWLTMVNHSLPYA